MKPRIALIAHDNKKDDMVSFAAEYVDFLRDPMTPHPHEPDVNALVRACDVHNVACATNLATAHLVLSQLQLVSRESHSHNTNGE